MSKDRNAPPAFDTQGPRPGEAGPEFFGLMRMWVEEANVHDSASDLDFMRLRWTSDGTSYAGGFRWARQISHHDTDDEVFVVACAMAVGERDGKLVYTLEVPGGAGLPRGQYQYMVFQMVSQVASGWDWTRAHPDI